MPSKEVIPAVPLEDIRNDLKALTGKPASEVVFDKIPFKDWPVEQKRKMFRLHVSELADQYIEDAQSEGALAFESVESMAEDFAIYVHVLEGKA